MIARSGEPTATRVILADDHGIVRDGIRTALEPHMEIVAEVTNGLDAVAAAHVLRPDLILMDVSLPGMNGIDATRRIRKRLPSVKILCVSMYSDTVFVRAALEAGASGYVLKESPLAELLEAIDMVKQGRNYIDPKVAAPPTIDAAGGLSTTDVTPEEALTAPQIEVLRLLAEGYSTREIAFRMRLGTETVAAHRQKVMDKLGIHDIVDITKYALDHGLIGLDSPPD